MPLLMVGILMQAHTTEGHRMQEVLDMAPATLEFIQLLDTSEVSSQQEEQLPLSQDSENLAPKERQEEKES
tara:strand:+ start:330 stop:542 length:213 start_codon:yes stop_codon:yes gene_type:complete